MKQDNEKVDVTKYVGEQIKKFRKEKKLTQKELGERVGVKHNTISSYESGTNEAEQDILFAIAKVLGISIDSLYPPIKKGGRDLVEVYIERQKGNSILKEESDSEKKEATFKTSPGSGKTKYMVALAEKIQPPVSEHVMLPIIGSISCGNGILAYENVEGFEETPESWLNGGKYFYLRAKGDSMKGLRIHDGDLLLIREQSDFENGEIVAALINGEAFLKRATISKDMLILESANPEYPPIAVPVKNNDIRIIGKLKKVVLDF